MGNELLSYKLVEGTDVLTLNNYSKCFLLNKDSNYLFIEFIDIVRCFYKVFYIKENNLKRDIIVNYREEHNVKVYNHLKKIISSNNNSFVGNGEEMRNYIISHYTRDKRRYKISSVLK